jgi:ABC-2 type transport system ATP-binding protein
VLVAQALVHRPPVIVLDEPTAGVDVELRQGLWQFVRRLNADGHTVVLTTHYLEEAETLCHRIAMLKAGRLVALDTTANLVGRHEALRLRVRFDGEVPAALRARLADQNGTARTFRLDGYGDVEPVLAALRASGCGVSEIELVQPDLEDVFVQIMHDDARAAQPERALA